MKKKCVNADKVFSSQFFLNQGILIMHTTVADA